MLCARLDRPEEARMLFAITGILKDDAEAGIPALQDAFNEHLAQPYRRLRLAGALRSREGRRSGFMVLLEADSFAEAEAYLHESPLPGGALRPHRDCRICP
jgi:hypothetical protein